MTSIDFSSQYLPPGVYIEEETTPLVSVLGVQPSVVALVGPSIGYRIHTETVILADTTPVQLTKFGISPASVAVAAADGTAYAGSDYDLVVGGGADASTATLPDNTLTIARSSGSTISNGSTVYVTYHYTDATYHDPLRAQDFDDVKDAFGEPMDLETGEILSPLSLAAKVALENGASQLVLVATADANAAATTRVHLTDAYAKIAAYEDVNLLVPLPVGITGQTGSLGDLANLGEDLKAEVENDARNTLFRIGILGYERTAAIDPATDVVAHFRSNRMMLAWPNRLNYYNGLTNQNIEVAGYFLAAAYAGQFAGRLPQIPLTRKQVRGFSGFPGVMANQMTTVKKNSWSSAGVAVAEIARDGRMICRHGVSTDTTNVNTKEVSLTRAKDTLVLMIQRTVEGADLIGTAIDAETPARVKGVVAGALEAAKTTEVIIDYQQIKVRQTSVDPSVIEVKFQYQPAYPLNYIVVAFSINTTTGEVNPLDLGNTATTGTGG
jgi:hypothetical protein